MSIDSSVGPLDALSPPHIISGHVPEAGRVRALGEHTQRLRNEFLPAAAEDRFP